MRRASRQIIGLMSCSLIFCRAAAAENAPLSLMLKTDEMQAVPAPGAEEPDPVPPDEPIEVDPSAPFVPSAKPADGPNVRHVVGGALMTVGGLAGIVGLSLLLSSIGITGTDDTGAPLPPPADPKTLQAIGGIALAAGAIGFIAGMSVYGAAQ
jgi:hypothetical protein